MSICVFCGNGPLTAEHAWPHWLIDILGGNATIQMWRSDTDSGAKWLAHGPDSRAHVQPKCVCGPCNNGWMSAVESDAKPVLAALIGDFALQLDAEQQRQLAAWAIKSTMVWECTAPKEMFYSQAEREHLRLTRSLPPDTLVWLGRNERSDFTICHTRTLSRSTPGPILREGLVTTLAIARLVIQVLTVRRADSYPTGSIPPLSVRPGAWRQLLVKIWPPRGTIQWPPPLTFTETGLEDLSRRFTNPPE